MVPAVRNLTLKWDALCGEEAACRHPVDKNTAGNVHAAEVTEAAEKLYKKLIHVTGGTVKRKERSIATFPNYRLP